MQIALLRSNTPRLWAPGRSAVQMHIVYCIIYNIITCICELDNVFVFVMCLWTSVFRLKLHGRHCRKNILPVMFGCPLSMSDSPRPPKNKVKTTKRLVHGSINHGRGWQRRQCCNWNWSWRSALEIQTKPIRRFVITEKAPTRAFSWLKAATTAFIFKTLLRHYAKQALTPWSLNVKLGPRRKGHKGRAVWLE